MFDFYRLSIKNYSRGATTMKHLIKILMMGICILLSATPFSPATGTPTISAPAQVQPSSVFDITYAVFVWTPVSTLFRPRYIDQFEFKAGDVFSAYTSRHGELTGTWIESKTGNSTWFQAWVVKEVPTTTTTTPETTTTIPAVQSTDNLRIKPLSENDLNFDINIWGISFTPPQPFQNFSTIIGYGAYLGADAFFFGFATVPTEPTFGSISPVEGEQGQTIEVTITGVNTTFESAGLITVDMGEKIDVGTPAVRSDTELRVSITIASDAEATARTVTVTYDNNVISKANAFTVLEQTN
jgi:hypothetical protein